MFKKYLKVQVQPLYLHVINYRQRKNSWFIGREGFEKYLNSRVQVQPLYLYVINYRVRKVIIVGL